MAAELKLQATLHRDVQKICHELAAGENVEIQNETIDIINELIWKKLQVFCSDLEFFSRHAKRTTITAEDVLLLVRRNPSLVNYLKTFLDSNSLVTKETKKRKRNSAAASVARPSTNVPSTSTISQLMVKKSFKKPETEHPINYNREEDLLTIDLDDFE